MGVNWKKRAGQVAGGVAGHVAGGPIGAAVGAKIGGAIGEGGTNGLGKEMSSWFKGNVSGKTNGSEAGPPGPPQNWWQEGMPSDRESIRNADGTLKGQYQINANFANAGPSNLGGLDARLGAVQGVDQWNVGNTAALAGMGALNAMALSTGPTAYANAQNQRIKLNAQNDLQKADANMAGSRAGAMSGLAASGGMDSGARERLGTNMMKANMANRSGIRNNAALAMADVSSNDALFKQGLMTQMPNMYLGLGDRLSENQRINSNLGMEKAGLWGNMANSESNRMADISKFNATTATEVDARNKTNAIQDIGNVYDSATDRWKTGNAAKAGQMAADAQVQVAKQGAKRGMFGNNGGFMGTGIG